MADLLGQALGFCHNSALNMEVAPGYPVMGFVKDRLGVEVQFGKCAFMAHNVCAKTTLFHSLDYTA